ncbi:phage head completion protein [Asticcacaulis tiandongensis]|uniref:phage head completion protein n=1 Tax=Asticcacaulis tiandongensis TaxID=2565365 RepID=UPI001129DAC5|nr:head-tail adaptor protein [Asticcacaulis tiandongensis]
MSAPLQAARLKTPAKLYRIARTPTEFGGFVRTPEWVGTVWGDFDPEKPVSGLTPEGEVLVRQQAVFTCRSAEGLSVGGRLVIDGNDWAIQAFDIAQDKAVRVRIERVQP